METPKIKIPGTQGKILKGLLGGVAALLLVALGLNVSGNDLDLGKLAETGSISESKIETAKDGKTLLYGKCTKEKFDCKDFKTQADAQKQYEDCGGLDGGDINGVDRDKDGLACESLPGSTSKGDDIKDEVVKKATEMVKDQLEK